MSEETRHWNPLEYENHSCPDCIKKDKLIAALVAETKMLRFSLAAHPDRQTSTGAAQAAMTYEIELRDRRITELSMEKAQADAGWAREVEKRDALLDAYDADYTLCDCCNCLTPDPIDCGEHVQCKSCTRLAELEADIDAWEHGTDIHDAVAPLNALLKEMRSAWAAGIQYDNWRANYNEQEEDDAML